MSFLQGTVPTARLEFSQALWSVRSIILMAVFLLLMGAAGLFGVTAIFLAPTPDAQGIAGSTAFLLAAMVLIVLLFGPAVAVFSTADSIVSERSARTLDALLARPVTRRGLALGKFLGRGAHLTLLASAGVLLGSLFFATRVPLELGKVAYFTFLVAVLFLVYAALALALSSVARTPATAMALGLVVWLTFYILWGFVVEGLKGVGLSGAAAWLNPNTLFLGAVAGAFPEPSSFAGLGARLDPGAALAGLAVWLVFALALAVEVFHRQDEAGT